MSDAEVYDALVAMFKEQYLGRQWPVAPDDTPEEIKARHGDTPLRQLRSLMILTGNHHLYNTERVVDHKLWNPRRPAVGKRLLLEAFKLPIGEKK
ncbi:MAG: hypothetical protein A2X35_01410 [Elusimicrobia bacterium GWA2_61_42]|nr:MAG: hypothetical protein A2X35_01410 [Elusimicrobia bacterium GWA2_61_42]OGR76805.1 MAG: hypothetical protein A2X38_11585 [Elusimicrobia bacterium GWC2_61_25]